MTQGTITENCACGCRIGLTVDTDLWASAIGVLSAWRRYHRCSIVANEAVPIHTGIAEIGSIQADIEGKKDWRLEKVGLDCVACHKVLQIPEDLTTLEGRPLHLECRVCYGCDKKTPYQMTWIYTEFGDTPIHHTKRCRAKLQEKINDAEARDSMQSDPGFGESEVTYNR